jgi:hypothetical protein
MLAVDDLIKYFCTTYKALMLTAVALIIEPVGSIICGRSKPEIAGLSQVIFPQMMDPSTSIISAAMVRKGPKRFLECEHEVAFRWYRP